MNDTEFEAVRRRMSRNPKSVLDPARNGSPPEMIVLGNSWTETPGLISPVDALDVFLIHLQGHKVPATPSELFTEPPNLAFVSLLGLSKINIFFEANPELVPRITKAWPGIFKWSLYLYSTRVQGLGPTDTRRRAAVDVISGSWYAICTQDEIRVAMVATPATIEVATRLWLEEDTGPIPSKMTIPVGTCALGNLLKCAEFDTLQRVLQVTNGKSDKVAKLAISRLRDALSQPKLNGTHLVLHLDFINSLSRSYKHAFRNALLSANAIWNVTHALVRISSVINTPDGPMFLEAMVSGFAYLYNCLDSSDGFTWVTQAIRAGLLQAFADCSPQFVNVDPDDLQMVKDVVGKILPRYMVYRSVIEAVDASMTKVDNGPGRDRVRKSILKDVWRTFHSLALERTMVLSQANAMKGKRITCDNVKCQRIGTNQDMRQCSACLSTFYCSKECQAVAWKEGDHKNMCKMKQRERLEGKSELISKKDAAFFHSLSLRDAWKHLPRLRSLGKDKFPDTPLSGLVVCIDYTVLPVKFDVKRLQGYTTGQTLGTTNSMARNDALVEKVQQNAHRYTLIESKVSCGTSMQCVLTLATGQFWTADRELLGSGKHTQAEDDEDFDEDAGTVIDQVDEVMARMALNNFMKANGEEPAF